MMRTRSLFLWLGLFVPAVAGLATSLLLMAQALSGAGTLPGCEAGSGCDVVLASVYAYVFGEPVATLAVLAYSVIVITLVRKPGKVDAFGRVTWWILLSIAASIAGAAIYFICLQAFVIQAWCLWCTATHIIGMLSAIALFAIGHVYAKRAGMTRFAMLRAVAVGVLCVMLLALAQQYGPPPATGAQRIGEMDDFDTGPGPDRKMSLLGQTIRFSPHDHPIVGSPDAPIVIMELFDYTCEHCRNLHHDLIGLHERFHDQLAVVTLPVPLHHKCNPRVTPEQSLDARSCDLAAIAMAVFLMNPGQFEAFHDWLFRYERDGEPAIADAATALRVAEQWVPGIEQRMREPAFQRAIREQIDKHIQLHEIVDGGMPTLLIGKAVIRGRPYSAEQLLDLLYQETALEP